MNLRTLETFVAVARHLNFSRAARDVHRAQSSVTEQIQSLEEDFGAALFDRSGRHLALTSAGARLLDYANEMLALAEEARAAVKDSVDLVQGPLVVGGLETLCAAQLVEPIATFRSRYPQVEIRLESGSSGTLRDDVKTGRLDVGFLFGSVIAEPDLESEELALEPLVVIVPPNHRFANRKEALSSTEFVDEPFLVTKEGCAYRRMFDEAFPAAGGEYPPIVGEFASIGAIGAMVEAGLGCALVPRIAVADAIAGGKVAACSWVDKEAYTPVTMIWRRRRVQTPTLRGFLATARASLGGTPVIAG